LKKLTAKMEEGITGSDVGEEGIAEALTFGSALHQAGDVDNVEVGRDFAEKNQNILIIQF
jgi:hypothetical protein